MCIIYGKYGIQNNRGDCTGLFCNLVCKAWALEQDCLIRLWVCDFGQISWSLWDWDGLFLLFSGHNNENYFKILLGGFSEMLDVTWCVKLPSTLVWANTNQICWLVPEPTLRRTLTNLSTSRGGKTMGCGANKCHLPNVREGLSWCG